MRKYVNADERKDFRNKEQSETVMYKKYNIFSCSKLLIVAAEAINMQIKIVVKIATNQALPHEQA